MGPTASDITALLKDWSAGDEQAREHLVTVLYDELRAIAARCLSGERAGHTLQPTALVHEAYLKLIGLDRIDWRNRAQFLAIAARVMRQILVDHARRRAAAKRGGGQRVTLDDSFSGGEFDLDLLALDRALKALEVLDADRARVVELRYFGGLNIEETGAVLGVSPATVKREWRSARAWLFNQLREEA